MTCIVGLELPGGRVMLGADSMACGGGAWTAVTDSKIWKGSGYLLGGAGSSRLIDKLKFDSPLPKAPPPGSSVEAWLVAKFIPIAQKCARSVMRCDSDEEDRDQVGLILGINGAVYLLDVLSGDMERSIAGYHALGSGSEVALGSLFTTARLEGLVPDPRDRLEMALLASSNRCLGVGGPFVYLEGKAASGRSKPHGNPKADRGRVRGASATAARKKPRVR